MTRVKICGITNLDDAIAACSAGADALGFVFAPEAKKRNRYVDPEHAQRIIEQLPPFVTTVAVCVDDPPERLIEYLQFVDRVQLCGDETPEEYRPICHRTVKAFRAGPDFKPEAMLEHPATAYLLDAYVPGAHGGTGATCDWDMAHKAAGLGRPLILAGGLTPANVAKAVQAVHPYGVDTSGGVETAPGKKDHERIRSFIENAKSSVS